MGSNLARNLASREGNTVAIYNRSTERTTLLMNEQTINAITLDPATMPDPVDTTRRLATVLEPVAPLVTSESMLADLAANPGKPVTAVLLRDPDYAYLESDFAIPGVVVVKTPKLIASDRRINSPLLDPLRTVWQANRDATDQGEWDVGAEGNTFG